jgi:hypothetical protein
MVLVTFKLRIATLLSILLLLGCFLLFSPYDPFPYLFFKVTELRRTSTINAYSFFYLFAKEAKAVLLHASEELGGEGYSSYSFSTSALDEGE